MRSDATDATDTIDTTDATMVEAVGTDAVKAGLGDGGWGWVPWGKVFLASKHYSEPRRRVGLIPTKREEQRQRCNLTRLSVAPQFRTLSGVAL